MRIGKSKIVLAWIGFSIGVLLTGDLFSQTAEKQQRTEVRQTKRLIEERSRDELRGELQIELTGLEQGDNGFRQNTEALLYSDRETSIMDKEELYKRKRAMYEAGQSFDSSPTETGRVRTCDKPVRSRITPVSLYGGSGLSGSQDNTHIWIYMGIPVVIGLLLLVRFRKRRLLNSIETENNMRRARFGKVPLKN